MKQALDLGHLRVAISPASKSIFRCHILKGTCLMCRIGLKAMNTRRQFDKDMTRDMNKTLFSL